MSAPTWPEVEHLARRQLAEYARGHIRENVNDYTRWYYGDLTAAPFCFIGISWTLAHAGATEADGLALIGGKHAYVPDIRHIPGYHAGHASMAVGAIVAVNGFNHIGFCVAEGASTFELLSFNSTQGRSDDAVTIKTYPKAAASGHVNLKYGTHPQEDDMQLTDKIETAHWVRRRWPDDKDLAEGMTVGEVIESSYGNARVAKEGVERLEKAVADLAAQVAELKGKGA